MAQHHAMSDGSFNGHHGASRLRTEKDRRMPQRNLPPLPSWQTDASGEHDIYAGMLHKGTIADQKFPDYVIDAIGRANDFRVRLSPSLGMESPCFFGCVWVADFAPFCWILPR
jgi:hypothetical protein